MHPCLRHYFVASALLVVGCSRRHSETMPAGGAECVASSIDQVSGMLHTRIVYDYDTVGRIVRAEWKYHEIPFERRGAVKTFEYDGAGRVASESVDEDVDGNFETTTRYFYDAAGQVARTESMTFPSPAVRAAIFAYDGGRKTRTEWRRDGAPSIIETVAYAPDGRSRVTTRTDGRGGVESQGREELDDRGRVTRVFVIRPSGERLRQEKKYDAAGRLATEIDFDDAGVPVSNTTYHFDARGALQREEFAHGGAVTLRTEYTYRGAWKAARCGALPGAP